MIHMALIGSLRARAMAPRAPAPSMLTALQRATLLQRLPAFRDSGFTSLPSAAVLLVVQSRNQKNETKPQMNTDPCSSVLLTRKILCRLERIFFRVFLGAHASSFHRARCQTPWARW